MSEPRRDRRDVVSPRTEPPPRSASGPTRAPASAHSLHGLQRAVGNRAITRMLSNGPTVIRRLYVETRADDPSREGTVGSPPVGYKWDASAKEQDYDVSPVKTGWKLYSLYRPKSTPTPSPTKETVTPTAPTELPPLSEGERQQLTTLQETLDRWGQSGVSVPEKDERRNLAQEVRTALQTGRGTRPVEEVARAVEGLRRPYEKAIRAKKASDEKARKLKEASLEQQRREAEDRELELAKIEERDRKLKAKAGSSLGALRKAFDDDEALLAVLETGAAPGLLQAVTTKIPIERIAALLEGSTIEELNALLIEDMDHVNAILKGAHKITLAQFRELLADTPSSIVADLAPKVKSGPLLLRMRADAASAADFNSTVTGLLAAGWDPSKAATALGKGGEKFTEDLKNQKTANGLIGRKGNQISWMSETSIAGDKAKNEKAAVEAALKALGNDKTKYDSLTVHKGGVLESRGRHQNDEGNLPGAANAVDYWEWGIEPPTTSWPGPRRLVTDKTSGRVYYTWTHYGESGSPAFVRIR